jgi:hypothetical protein
VRFTLLLASSVLAASLALGGCSTSGGSQALPGGSSVTPMGHHQLQLVAAGAQHQVSCPSSKYFTCLTLYKGSNSIEICISTSGNCTSGLSGEYTWSQTIIKVKSGKKYKKIKASWSPNPGNPSTNTLIVKKIKNSGGKVIYAEDIQACGYPSGSCISGAIGLIGG